MRAAFITLKHLACGYYSVKNIIIRSSWRTSEFKHVGVLERCFQHAQLHVLVQYIHTLATHVGCSHVSCSLCSLNSNLNVTVYNFTLLWMTYHA